MRGLKYFAAQPLLQRLHDIGNAAIRRQPHIAHGSVRTLILLWLFSPIVDSCAGWQQASELDKVRRKLRSDAPRWGRCRNRSRCSILSRLADRRRTGRISCLGQVRRSLNSIDQTITAVDMVRHQYRGACCSVGVAVSRSLVEIQSAYRLHITLKFARSP